MTILDTRLNIRSADFLANAAAMRTLVDGLRAQLDKVAQGGGEAARAKHVARGKLLPRERVQMLLDPGTPFLELAPLAAGQWVLVNGSRAYLADALARWPDLLAVHITASPAVLRARLLARGRESAAMVESRVQRALQLQPPGGSVPIELHNDGALDDAGQRLLSALRQCPGWPE
ncbi:phosphonate metabolism protein/1,5-bisphosphokinase (PRPP-forming) PhnN [Verminephrobacter sp. Larva24]|nr:phosphonate metabolism protein/1,5-bisphosphokinase (PRPP-forming) PhnN [Verminephrobacter sp. Larva24]